MQENKCDMFVNIEHCVFADGYSGLVLLRAYSVLSTVRPVINRDSQASEIQSFFLVLNGHQPFHSGFLPRHVPMFDGILY